MPKYFQGRVDKIFMETIDWYKTNKNKAKSKNLLKLFDEEIDKLQNAKTICTDFVKTYEKFILDQDERRTNLRNMISFQKKLVNDFRTDFTTIKNEDVRRQHAATFDLDKQLLGVSIDQLHVLERFWRTREAAAEHKLQDFLNLMKLCVSLKVSRANFNRIFSSSRAIVTAVPGVGLPIVVANAAYDAVKPWITPIKDFSAADQLHLWIEKRAEMLQHLV